MHVITTTERFLEQAFEAHKSFGTMIHQAKEKAFDCGLYLLSAQASLADGELWTDLMEAFEEKIPRTTAYRYMQFGKSMLAWAGADKPRLADKPDKLQAHARAMVMESALDFMSLCREIGMIKQLEGGGRRSEKRAGGPAGQMFFDYDFLSNTFFMLNKGGRTLLAGVPVAKLQEDCKAAETSLALMRAELESRPKGLTAENAENAEKPHAKDAKGAKKG